MKLETMLGIDFSDPLQRNAHLIVEDDHQMWDMLIARRIALGLSQAAVANLMGVSESAVRQIECERDTWISALRRYKLVLGVVAVTKIHPFEDVDPGPDALD